jgi:hypothetical protein
MAGHQVSAENFELTFIPWPNIVLWGALCKKTNCRGMYLSSPPKDLAYTDKGTVP